MAARYLTCRDNDATSAPVVAAPMRLGHRLLLDLRSPAQHEAYLTGWFDDDFIAMAQRLLGPDDVALDVGGNVGLWTVPLAWRAAAVGAHVLAFEPAGSNVARLEQNLTLNSVGAAATVIPKALSDRRATRQLVLREDFAAGATTGNASIRIADGTDERFDAVVVPAVTLGELPAVRGAGSR